MARTGAFANMLGGKLVFHYQHFSRDVHIQSLDDTQGVSPKAGQSFPAKTKHRTEIKLGPCQSLLEDLFSKIISGS